MADCSTSQVGLLMSNVLASREGKTLEKWAKRELDVPVIRAGSFSASNLDLVLGGDNCINEWAA